MTDTGKQLAQIRPANTNNTLLYAGSSALSTVITSLKICNTSAAAATARVFHDADLTTYDETTAIVWDRPIATNDTVVIGVGPMNGAGNIAVRSSVNSALTFTLYGVETTA